MKVDVHKKETILIAEDSPINRHMLCDALAGRYNIIQAENGEQAITLIANKGEKIALVLLDLIMPKVNGLEVLQYMNANKIIQRVPVIIITEATEEEIEEAAFELGASDFVPKPFSRAILRRRINNIITLYRDKNHMRAQINRQNQKLLESHEKLVTQNEFLVNALSSVVEFRNRESGEHTTRVQLYTKIMVNCLMEYFPQYELTEDDAAIICSASALHDLGKIAIPDNILLKPGPLSTEEYEVIKKHPLFGCEILDKFRQEESKFQNTCYEICRYHHERYDGKGYPEGLKGDQIPISAQIVSIVDVFDALTSKRVYKDAITKDTAYNMIIAGECGQFSPDILECFTLSKKELCREAELIEQLNRDIAKQNVEHPRITTDDINALI